MSEPHVQISSYVFDVVRAAVPLLLIDDVFEQKEEIAEQVLAMKPAAIFEKFSI